MRPDWCVGVVVPACNEAASIERCIDSILIALARAAGVRSGWVVVVADSCRDSTAELARRRLGNQGVVLECTGQSPGIARCTGAAEVLRHFSGCPLDRVWMANTDADSHVGPDWITHQLDLADRRYCGVAGIVQVESVESQHPETIRALFQDYLIHADGTHPHVHGANLGLRGDAYVDAGGWSSLTLAEDHCLWSRVRERGWNVVSSIASVVITSGRLHGRATGGFADTLRKKLELLYA